MTWIQVYAFVVLPVLIVAIGWIGVLLFERDIRRARERDEAESLRRWSQERS